MIKALKTTANILLTTLVISSGIFILGCPNTPELITEEHPRIGYLDIDEASLAFVERYHSQLKSSDPAARNETPLQVYMRIGPANDPTVCTTGTLFGPYTVTGNSVEGDPVVTADQPTLRLANQGNLDICTIITAPVAATVTASVDSVEIDSEECNETPQRLDGIWQGAYSCTSSCGDDSGTVTLTLVQNEYSAIYYDDGEAYYEGSVCGNQFRYSGGGSGYTESGTFTLNNDGSASKTSSYEEGESSCGGSCSDPNLQRISTQVLFDDFDDSSLDSNWDLATENTTGGSAGWSYQESGTNLVVSDVTAETVHSENGQTYSQLSLSQGFTAANDFLVEFNLDWSGEDSAMQYLTVSLYNQAGDTRVAMAGYSDAWISYSGQYVTNIAGTTVSSEPGTLDNTDSAVVRIVRNSGLLRIFFNGVEIQQSYNYDAVAKATITFGHYPYDNGEGLTSSFGTISLDELRISGSSELVDS